MAHHGEGVRPGKLARPRQCAAFHNVAGAGLDAEVIRRTPRRRPRAAAYLVCLARLPKLFDGRLAADPAFHFSCCRTETIGADPPCAVELDGQLFGTTPVTLSILPGALSVLDCRPATREVAGFSRANS